MSDPKFVPISSDSGEDFQCLLDEFDAALRDQIVRGCRVPTEALLGGPDGLGTGVAFSLYRTWSHRQALLEFIWDQAVRFAPYRQQVRTITRVSDPRRRRRYIARMRRRHP